MYVITNAAGKHVVKEGEKTLYPDVLCPRCGRHDGWEFMAGGNRVPLYVLQMTGIHTFVCGTFMCFCEGESEDLFRPLVQQKKEKQAVSSANRDFFPASLTDTGARFWVSYDVLRWLEVLRLKTAGLSDYGTAEALMEMGRRAGRTASIDSALLGKCIDEYLTSRVVYERNLQEPVQQCINCHGLVEGVNQPAGALMIDGNSKLQCYARGKPDERKPYHATEGIWIDEEVKDKFEEVLRERNLMKKDNEGNPDSDTNLRCARGTGTSKTSLASRGVESCVCTHASLLCASDMVNRLRVLSTLQVRMILTVCSR